MCLDPNRTDPRLVSILSSLPAMAGWLRAGSGDSPQDLILHYLFKYTRLLFSSEKRSPGFKIPDVSRIMKLSGCIDSDYICFGDTRFIFSHSDSIEGGIVLSLDKGQDICLSCGIVDHNEIPVYGITEETVINLLKKASDAKKRISKSVDFAILKASANELQMKIFKMTLESLVPPAMSSAGLHYRVEPGEGFVNLVILADKDTKVYFTIKPEDLCAETVSKIVSYCFNLRTLNAELPVSVSVCPLVCKETWK